jgi:hypothetical protein
MKERNKERKGSFWMLSAEWNDLTWQNCSTCIDSGYRIFTASRFMNAPV